MPKLTVYIPVDLEHAFNELRKRGVDCSKLFCDAMLGHLSLCDDYEPPANTLEDLAIRLKRLEEWVAGQIDKEEEKEEEPEPELSGTIHIGTQTKSLCGVGKVGRIFPPAEAEELIREHEGCSPCLACKRLFHQQVAHADGGHRVPLCGSDSSKVFDADDLIQLQEDGYKVCEKCLELSTDTPDKGGG